ncbi:MAG: coiled coil domain-containing protein [Pseudomonadales bacterium]|nr:coiled coil domain-containing protein [Pseudomonadales bacterium]
MRVNDKELYQQKYQAQLDGVQADVDKLKARAQSAKADAQIDLNKLVDDLEHQLKTASAKLTELSHAGEGAFDTMKKGVETSWESLKNSVHDAVGKFKDQGLK